MASIDLSGWSAAHTILNAVTAPTAAPNGDSDVYTARSGSVVTFISGTGNATLQLWLHDGANWFKGDTYDVTSATNPEAVAWSIPSKRFTFQATAVSGGNVTVKVL